MPILTGDVKLVASQVMNDVEEGGGAPTLTVIQDGTSNSLFNDISELDRAGGRVNLRKVFASIQTDTTDTYLGGNVIVAEPPADPRVAVSLFTTRNVFDIRSEAVSRIEAYLNAGPEWPGFLYENHIAGQRSFQLFMRTNQAPPTIGRTLLLRRNEGLGTMFEQYVRVTRVATEERTFTHGDGTVYQAQIVTCDISDALRYDFSGSPATKFFTKAANTTLVRDTLVADAATYFGCVPLTEPVAIGDIKVTADSVYTQLVPNSRTETSVIDQVASANVAIVLATTPIEVTVNEAPYSQRIRIGQENRGYNYVSILKPLPAPGSVSVTYRALGRNYRITDNGDGTISGAGSGVLNYLTGSISITLEALPDDRSGLMIYWGEKVAYTNRSGQAGFREPEYAFQLEKTGIEPGTLSIQWTSSNVVKTATDNGQGKIVGDAVGEVAYSPGKVMFRPNANAFPDPNAEFDVDYAWSTLITESKPGLSPDASGVVSFTLADEPAPRSLRIQWITTRTVSESSGLSLGGSSSNKSNSSLDATEQVVTLVDRTYTAYGPLISGGTLGPGQGWS